MKMKKYEVKIKGWKDTPIVWNRIKKEIEDEKKLLKKNEYAEYEENNWMKKAETNNGNLIMPRSWPISTLINSAKQTGMTPHFETKKNKTYTRYVQGMQILPAPQIIVGKIKDVVKIEDFYSSQPGKQNSGKVWKIFPALVNWETTFVIVDTHGRMLLRELKELLEYSGQFIGMGDQRNRGYGRFDVDYIRELKQ